MRHEVYLVNIAAAPSKKSHSLRTLLQSVLRKAWGQSFVIVRYLWISLNDFWGGQYFAKDAISF